MAHSVNPVRQPTQLVFCKFSAPID